MIKEGWVARWSKDRTVSLGEMAEKYPACYDAMMNELERVVSETRQRELKAARSTTLKLMQKAGCDTTSWAKVDEFVLNFHLSRKKFFYMTVEELDASIPQLHAIIGKGKKREKKVTGESNNDTREINLDMLNACGVKIDTSHVQGSC